MAKKTKRLPNVHPGRILRIEVLEARGMSQSQLAEATGLPVSRSNDLDKERLGITTDTAIRLGKVLGISPRFWLGLQLDYDTEEAMLAKEKEYDSLVQLPLALAH